MDNEVIKKSIKSAANNSVALARFFLEEYPDLVIDKVAMGGRDGSIDLYYYKDGIYTFLFEQKFDMFLMDFLNNNGLSHIWKIGRINEIRRAIIALNVIPVVEFDAYDNLLCFKNGILNLDNLRLIGHDKKYYFRTQIDIDYKKSDESCPNFVEFLKSLFTDGKNECDQETVSNIVRIGGYLLYPQNRLKKMFLFLGEGSNGKSLLIDIFCIFFAKENISYLDLNTLSQGDSKERERIIGSRINVTTEAKSNNVDSEMIKKIISSEGIEIHRKFLKSIPYKPVAKLVVASNTNPYFNDSTHGIYRRIFPITFANRYVSKEDYLLTKTPEKKRIFLAKDEYELMDNFKKEKAAILNLFLNGLRDLRNHGWQLKNTVNSRMTMKAYKESSDTAALFLIEHYEEADDFITGPTVEEILSHYRSWYRDNVTERPLKYSVVALSRKIKELFRIESNRIYLTGGGRKTIFPLKEKNYVEEQKQHFASLSANGDNNGGGAEDETPVLETPTQPSLREGKSMGESFSDGLAE